MSEVITNVLSEAQEAQYRPTQVGSRAAARCSSCAMQHLCMPQGASGHDLKQLEELIRSTRRVRRDDMLYCAGDPCLNLYAVRSGSLKVTLTHEEGREQVIGFRMPGDVVGLDGIAHEAYAGCAVALEDSTVCVIPYADLKQLCQKNGFIQNRLHRLMSERIMAEAVQMMVLGSLSVDERVAAFLLDLSERNALRGFSPAEFTLRMRREDIGSYLGMTIGSVSRTLSILQNRGLIQVNGKHIVVRDLVELRKYRCMTPSWR